MLSGVRRVLTRLASKGLLGGNRGGIPQHAGFPLAIGVLPCSQSFCLVIVILAFFPVLFFCGVALEEVQG